MKVKSVFVVSDLDWNAWEIASKEALCLSIINQAVPNKDPRIYHHFFSIDQINVEEAKAISQAFTNNSEFNKSSRDLEIYYRGEVVCDDDNNILKPDCLNDQTKDQYELWLHSMPWPTEDDCEINSQTKGVEVTNQCKNNDVNADW